jgi:glycosyltransferase involved in cell wall biosynthesis
MAVRRVIMIEDTAAISGGATMIAHQASLALAKAGLDVVYLAGGPANASVLDDAGIIVRGVGNAPLLARSIGDALVNGLYDADAARQVRGWITEFLTPDTVVHVHGYLQTLSPSIFNALTPARGQIVLHAHDFFYVCPTGSFFNFRTGEKCNLRPMSRACILSACDKRSRIQKFWRVERMRRVHDGVARLGNPPVIALHEGMTPILQLGGIAPDRIHIHRNPVTPWCDVRVRAEDNRAVLFAGRLAQEKGADLLARACAQVGAPLIIYGDGPLASVIPGIYPQAQLMGWGDRAALAQAAMQSRLMVLATRQIEAFGLAVFEAGLSGVPVLLSPLALVGPEVEAAGFGVRVNPERTGVLAETIAGLMQDDDRVRALSKAGFAARDHLALSSDAYADGLRGLYDRVLARSPEYA